MGARQAPTEASSFCTHHPRSLTDTTLTYIGNINLYLTFAFALSTTHIICIYISARRGCSSAGEGARDEETETFLREMRSRFSAQAVADRARQSLQRELCVWVRCWRGG